jgi:hypothetical protein
MGKFDCNCNKGNLFDLTSYQFPIIYRIQVKFKFKTLHKMQCCLLLYNFSWSVLSFDKEMIIILNIFASQGLRSAEDE